MMRMREDLRGLGKAGVSRWPLVTQYVTDVFRLDSTVFFRIVWLVEQEEEPDTELEPTTGPCPEPRMMLEPPVTMLEPPFTTLDSPSTMLEPPFTMLEPPFTTLEPPFTMLEPPFKTLEQLDPKLPFPPPSPQVPTRPPSAPPDTTVLPPSTAAKKEAGSQQSPRLPVGTPLPKSPDTHRQSPGWRIPQTSWGRKNKRKKH